MLTARDICYRDSFFLKAKHDTLERRYSRLQVPLTQNILDNLLNQKCLQNITASL